MGKIILTSQGLCTQMGDKKSRNILLWLISYQNIPEFVYIFFIELSQ